MIRDTPTLTDKINDASRNSGNTILNKKFPGGQVVIAGGNSPASLCSRPIPIILIDERDRLAQNAGGEGDPALLAFKRAQTFHNKKFGEWSTPTIKGRSPIESAYERSDKRKFNLHCPYCGDEQVLKWAQLRYEAEKFDDVYVVNSAEYECEHCGDLIKHSKKNWMLQNGVWIPEGKFNGVAGFWINEMYSPWVRWDEMAENYEKCKDNKQEYKVFVNTSLGQTYEQEFEEISAEEISSRTERYNAQVPEGATVLTAGVDVQKNRLEVEVVGWGYDYESWSMGS